MNLSNEQKSAYEIVKSHLETERGSVQAQLVALGSRMRELNNSIGTLAKHLQVDTPTLFPTSSAPRTSAPRYANLSTRWAILDTLVDSGPMATSEIAEALKSAGFSTRAASLANNVSAVLTNTMRDVHQEVQSLQDGRWELNEKGKHAIAHIRTTPKFLRAVRGASERSASNEDT